MLINADKFGEALQGVTSPKSPALDPLQKKVLKELLVFWIITYLVSDLAESRLERSLKLREVGGKTVLPPAELFSNSGTTTSSSNGDSDPTSSSDDSSLFTF